MLTPPSAAARQQARHRVSAGSPRAGPWPPRAGAQCAALVARLAARFFARHPHSLGVALGPAPVPGAPRRIDAVDVRQRGWWRQAGLPRGALEPPMFLLAVDLLDHLPPEPALALLWAVGEHAPPGTLLLADARGSGPIGRALADRAALARVHPRLRRDDVHRPLEACGLGWRWRGRLAEVWRGVPPWALYEVGVDV